MFELIFFILFLSYKALFKHDPKKSDMLLWTKREDLKFDIPGSLNPLNFLILDIKLFNPLLRFLKMLLKVLIVMQLPGDTFFQKNRFFLKKKASYEGFLNC